ncbi:MAG: hypothetical protein BRD29_02865 [Bacteroidetes bacterium QH_2_67_10]|nr:MAG: hypothetical protein BRD29_02865 [Bacteroidetes bacterium QH_2_67_10]
MRAETRRQGGKGIRGSTSPAQFRRSAPGRGGILEVGEARAVVVAGRLGGAERQVGIVVAVEVREGGPSTPKIRSGRRLLPSGARSAALKPAVCTGCCGGNVSLVRRRSTREHGPLFSMR